MATIAFYPHCRRILTPVGLAVVLLCSGCSSSPDADPTVASSSPFALNSGSGTQIKVNTLRTFGDSYTDLGYTKPRGHKNWAQELAISSGASTFENYAIGGARAASGQSISFDRQLNNWQAKNSPLTDRDLSIAYFGYNDIGNFGSSDNLAKARAGYAQGITQLVDKGATNGNNRIFVTQITDWSRTPQVPDALRGQVLAWNRYIASVANSNPNIVAVDLFTVFERVQNDPGKFGFVNTTEINKQRSYVDYLFYDGVHFGTKGQEIIHRVFNHYLTRGWNWANAIEAGSAASAQLNQDIDQGLLALNLQQKNQKYSGSSFSVVPFGMQTQAIPDRHSQRRAFNHYAAGDVVPAFSGVALNFNASKALPGGGAQMGLAVHQKSGSTLVSSAEQQTRMGMQSHAASLYWVKPMSDFLLTTQLSQTSQQFSQSAADDLVLRSVDNSRKGSNLSMESKLRYSFSTPAWSVTPWASLTQTRQRLDASTLQTLYTSDVTFSATQSREWVSGLGLDLQFTPIRLAGGRQFQWGGSVMHRESTSRDSFVVSMREASQQQTVQRELIERAGINQTYLGLNAQLELDKRWSLSANYSADLKQLRQTQAVQVRAKLHF